MKSEDVYKPWITPLLESYVYLPWFIHPTDTHWLHVIDDVNDYQRVVNRGKDLIIISIQIKVQSLLLGKIHSTDVYLIITGFKPALVHQPISPRALTYILSWSQSCTSLCQGS